MKTKPCISNKGSKKTKPENWSSVEILARGEEKYGGRELGSNRKRWSFW